MKIAIVGAGFSGCVIAHQLAMDGHKIDLFDSRKHIGGNCYTERDENGIMVHTYGPHIFHTDNEHIWNFVNSFEKFIPFINRVKANSQGKVFSLPINLHTINQFFDKSLNPEEAKDFITKISNKEITTPKSFEEQALKFVGNDLYEAFFKGYTQKQWGRSPKDLPASILKRLPLRFNYDDNYFNHKYQGIPINGYTPIFNKLIDNKNIILKLLTEFSSEMSEEYEHVFFSGTIDSWFGHKLGLLPYRTLHFQKEYLKGDFQGCAVMNYCDEDTPYTRITEHKHFSPWEKNENSIIYREFSKDYELGDIPYYPVRLKDDKKILKDYIDLALSINKVSFVGRLGTYRYLDMDVTISEALNACDMFRVCIKNNSKIPVFFNNPI